MPALYQNLGLGGRSRKPVPGSSISLDTFDGDLGTRPGSFSKTEAEISYSPLSPLIQGSPFSFDNPEAYSSGFNSGTNNESRGWFRFGKQPSRKANRSCSERKPTGWKLGTTIAAGLTLIILLGNSSLLAAFGAQLRRNGYTGNIAPAKSGDCTYIKKLGIVVHLVINVVSTLLLGASNYCMQTISAPTRRDVDKAHARGIYLDIGVPSVRNLRFIQKKRLFFWFCLGLTSIPLHLVYNSIFFVSTVNNLYPIYIANEAFTTGASWNKTMFKTAPGQVDTPESIQNRLMHTDQFEKLPNDDCLNAYAKTLVEDRGAVVVVVEDPRNCSTFTDFLYNYYSDRCLNAEATSLYAQYNYATGFLATTKLTNWYGWLCSQETYYYDYQIHYQQISKLCSDGAWKDQLSPNEWTLGGAKVKYCLSEKIAPKCHLQVALSLIGVVIAFNAVKVIVISIMAASNLINQEPLVTVGDAAASFIQRPEPTTKGMCMLSAREIINSHEGEVIPAKEYQPQPMKRSAAVSWRRWIVASLMTLTALIVILGLLGYAVATLNSNYGKGDFNSLWSLGVGALTPHTMVESWGVPGTGEAAVIATVLITNMPQLLLSFLYLILNGVVTAMSAASEWSNYGYNLHRPLRVSFPTGGQRSTFFLQLPYRYSVPMMALSVLMHWLISQSFFIAQIYEMRTWRLTSDQKQNPTTTQDADITTTAAYSPMAIFLTAFVVAIVFMLAVVIGRLRLREGMPLAGSCSAAISASCHVLEGTSIYEPVKWGVVIPPEEGKDGVGHCTFSNYHVDCLEPGKRYA
ncbi:hypothetical protein V2G26_012932 [Clonostachys chloroleuca]